MPEVWIPSLMRKLTNGREKVIVEGQTLREVIENLDAQFPGVKGDQRSGDLRRLPDRTGVGGRHRWRCHRGRLANPSAAQ